MNTGCHCLGVDCAAHVGNNAFCEHVFHLLSAAKQSIKRRGIQSTPKVTQHDTIVLLGPNCSITNYNIHILRSIDHTKCKSYEIHA